MAAKANVIGIIVQPGGTALIGRESTVADDGVAGINLRGYVTASFIQTANDSSANYHANSSGSNTSSSRESYTKTTGFNAGNYNLQIYNGAMDTAGVLKYVIAHSAADKKVMLADDDLSDISFDTGTTSILDSTISTPSAITIGKNGSAANTVVDVSSSNHTIRCGQGMNFYNGGTLLARASTLYLGTTSSSPYAGENSSRYGIFLSGGKIGGASTSAAPTGTWYVSSIKSTISTNILRFTTGTCTITGKNTSANRFFEITDGNIYHSDGTLTIDSGVAAEMQWDAAATDQDNGPYNFIINDASCTARIRTNLEVLNNMTITAGTFNTHSNDGGADKNLTVTGACTLNGGTFTGNASTVSHGSLTISSGTYNATNQTTTLNGTVDVGMRVDGTFNNNDGTFVIDGSITKVQMGSIGGAPTGFSINNAPFHHLTINDSINFAWGTGTLFNVEGDLIVAAGQTLGANNENSGIKVLGDVTLNGTLGSSYLTNDCEFGSLTIASGGTYSATSGTTTITGKESGACFANSGTFTHNKGKVSFTKSGGTWTTISNSGGQSFYDVNVDSSTGAGIYANDPLTINNNFTLVRGTFIANDDGSHDGDITVHGLTSIGGGANATKLENDGRTLQLKSVTVLSNGTIDVAEGTNNFGGIRNLGGTIS